jgi:hypothetical protein
MIAEVEQLLLTRLKAKIAAAAAEVKAFPDNPDMYRLAHPKGAVLLAYNGGDFTGNVLQGGAVQMWRAQWMASILARNLNDHSGAYALLDAVRGALIGVEFGGSTKTEIIQEKFLKQKDGVWSYVQFFAHDLPIVQGEDVDVDDPDQANLVQVTTLDHTIDEELTVP